jgi:hypothetical protein
MPSSQSIFSNRLVEYFPILSTQAVVAREKKRVADVLAKGSNGAVAHEQPATTSQRSSIESATSADSLRS